MPTETMAVMAAKRKESKNERSAEMDAAVELVRMAKQQGLALTGPGGLLKRFTKTVLETALNEEMNEHLGRAKHEKTRDGRAVNARNGTVSKTVTTDAVGPVRIEVPRDRDASFEPVIVRKRQRRLNDVDEVVLSLYAKGLTTGEISAHFREIYGASVSKETVSRITDRVIEEMNEWSRMEERKLREAARCLREGIDETTTYLMESYPVEHRRRIRTNNMIERLNREIRRRTRVVGSFPDGRSALMLISARIRYVTANDWSARRYLDMSRLHDTIQEAS